jgi:putative Holliday junction resolvase
MAAFKSSLPPIPPKGRVLGLDVGVKRVGAAVSDSAQGTALSKAIWPREWKQLKNLIVGAQAVGVVLGEPKHMSGEAGERAQSVTDLAKLIEAELQLPVALMDERLTSVQAQNAFFEQREAGSRQTRASSRDAAQSLDASAAVLLLQAWLDVRRNESLDA